MTLFTHITAYYIVLVFGAVALAEVGTLKPVTCANVRGSSELHCNVASFILGYY